MIFYRAICGSRSYGLEIEQSDYDIVLVGTQNIPAPFEKAHNILLTSEDFISRLLLVLDAYFIQWFYPREVLADTEITQYILSRADEILLANCDRVYQTYMKKANSLSVDLELWWQIFPKRVVYSCLFYDTVSRFANQDMPFGEAFRPEEEFRQWLLEVRRNEVSFAEIQKRHTALQQQAEAAQGFYIGKENKVVLRKTMDDLSQLLGIDASFLDNIKR